MKTPEQWINEWMDTMHGITLRSDYRVCLTSTLTKLLLEDLIKEVQDDALKTISLTKEAGGDLPPVVNNKQQKEQTNESKS